jgi:multidrug efflux pump subunit AcrB
MSAPPAHVPRGLAGRLAAAFTHSRLTPLAVIASLLLGAFAVLLLPREEEPQIKVPMIDVLVAMPGATAHEVENRVTRPMEKLLWEVPGVEYVYSTSRPGSGQSIVRFKVGSDLEQSLVRLNQKLQQHFDLIPPGASQPIVKPRSIDDVPILALTLHSRTVDHFTLRRLAAQLDDAIKSLPEVAETNLIGGTRRIVCIEPNPAALAAHGLTFDSLAAALAGANARTQAGAVATANRSVLVETGPFLRDAREVGAVVVAAPGGKPVYLRDIATITDGAEEPVDYVLFGRGGASPIDDEAAVTLSVAKRPGANAITVVERVLHTVAALRGVLLPAEVEVAITRNYGATAAEKSNELLLHMGIAVFGVTLLILVFLGWRESLVVLLAIPVTLGLTLLVFYLYGYTLNRITLFALIFSVGILVDDAIVVVENIVRHLHLPSARGRPLRDIAVEAVEEVGNPTLVATWAVIAAVLPMAFVGGLMGPYMRPIPIGASAAMLFSLAVAFIITPWAALRVLGRHPAPAADAHGADSDAPGPDTFFTRLYHRIMEPLIARARVRWVFLGVVALLTLGAVALVPLGRVQVKMLPFDNKSEFQLILNMPEGSTLEQTAAVAHELAASVRSEPEVRDYQIYAGTAAPFNFNGLVRHYFQRRGANVADVQVNLLSKDERRAQSHEIATRVRPRLAAIAARHGARLAVAEVPPGPPVLETLVAEIYGPTEETRLALATRVRDLFKATPGVVDIDWYVEEEQPTVQFVVDRAQAALHGISTDAIARTVQTALTGTPAGLLHAPAEREDVPLVLRLPLTARTRPEDLLAVQVRSDRDPSAPLVPLRELVSVEHTKGERNLYRKNLHPVIYVTGDVSGAFESPVPAILAMNGALARIDAREFGGSQATLEVFNLNLPTTDLAPALKWDGEWHVTLEVFRDMGLAFAAVCILIYMLMVGWFRSYVTPFVIMAVIPLSLIGILPAHWLAGAFFTATSMIGFMAGAGIIVRNAIILVDFIELRRAQGRPLAEAVVEAGAVRFRPMLLTALAVIVGASAILGDPIFQGLALSLMAGEVASLLVSRFAVPVLYFMTFSAPPARLS